VRRAGALDVRAGVRPAEGGNRRSLVWGAGVMALVAATLLAGCGRFPSSPGTGVTSPGARTTGAPPRPGSPARAEAFAEKLLSHVNLPPGARRATRRHVPATARRPASMVAGAVDAHGVFSLRQPMAVSFAYLTAHTPAGMHRTGSGEGGGSAATTVLFVTYTPNRVPAGVSQADLVVGVLSAPSGAWLRADAEVIPFPARSAAEFLSPDLFHAVIVSAFRANQRPHTVTRAITSAEVIARLAELLNSLPAAPPQMLHCPAMVASYQVAFATAPGARPGVVVTAPGCATDEVRVEGRGAQPALWDPREKLAAAVRNLLGLGQ
jgi:hypothetical protein